MSADPPSPNPSDLMSAAAVSPVPSDVDSFMSDGSSSSDTSEDDSMSSSGLSSLMEQEAFPWSDPPFQIDVPADPTCGQNGKFTLKLNEDVLQEIFDLESPIYHAFPGRSDLDDDKPYGILPSHCAIAGVEAVEVDFDKTVYEPLREAFRRRQNSATHAATVSWEAPSLPNASMPDWRRAEGLCKHLRGTLFGTVGALVALLPAESKLSIADEDANEPCTVRILAMLPREPGHQCLNADKSSRVAMVVEVVPWLSEPDIEALVASAGQLSVEDILSISTSRRMGPECHWVALHRLALRMRAHNAPIGILYNGCEAIVVERDFEHDTTRLIQLTRQVHQESPRTRSQAAAEARLDLPTIDLQLKVWKTGFSHPADPCQQKSAFQSKNPAALFASMAWYALGQLQARPQALDDTNMRATIQRYLLNFDKCPCLMTATNRSSDTEALRRTHEHATWSRHDEHSRPSYECPSTIVGLLQRVRLAGELSTDGKPDKKTTATRRAEEIEAVIAVGTVPCSSGPPRAYLLTAEVWLQGYSHDCLAEAWEASLHIVIESNATAVAHAALQAALEVVDTDDGRGGLRGGPLRPDHLYLVSSTNVVSKAIGSLRSACGEDNIFCQQVVLTLPGLSRHHWSSYASRPAGHNRGTLDPDPLLCKCPRGLCDAVCPLCVDGLHECERAAIERHIHTMLLGFDVENVVHKILRKQRSFSHLYKDVSTMPLFDLKLAIRGSQADILALWPMLEPLLERRWPVRLHAGVLLGDVFRYAEVAVSSGPDLEFILEYDDTWLTVDTDMCDRAFSYLANDSTYLDALAADIVGVFASTFAQGFKPDWTDACDIAVGFLDPRTIELFGCKARKSQEGLEAASEKPTAFLMNLSMCAFLGGTKRLAAANPGSGKLKRVAMGPKGPLQAFWREKLYCRQYAKSLEDRLYLELLGFNDWWSTSDGDVAAPSAAPASGPVAGPERAPEVQGQA